MKNLKTKLSYAIYFVLVVGSVGCDAFTKDHDKVNAMACPVTVIAKHELTENTTYPSIVLKDGDGYVKGFMGSNAFTYALCDTYNVGDTIRSCN